MNVAETSMAAFRSIQHELQRKELEVMTVFADAAMRGVKLALTREALAKRLKWKEASICGRCRSLVENDFLVETTGGMTKSGRAAKLVSLPARFFI